MPPRPTSEADLGPPRAAARPQMAEDIKNYMIALIATPTPPNNPAFIVRLSGGISLVPGTTSRLRPFSMRSRGGNDAKSPQAPRRRSPKGRPRAARNAARPRERFGAADRGTLADEEVRRPEIASRPKSTITGRHDEGSGANETIDGLDEIQEAVRHATEDLPASEKGDDFERLPVFDRAESEPKV